MFLTQLQVKTNFALKSYGSQKQWKKNVLVILRLFIKKKSII